MPGVKQILSRVFKRGHPDVYDAVKAYAEKKGIRADDVIAASVASYLAADEEGKEELEEIMKERRAGVGSPNIKDTIAIFTELANGMGAMFKAMNEARSSLSVSAVVQDYKTLVGAAQEIKKMGSEGGEGSIEDMAARAFFEGLFGSMGSKMSEAVKKGKKTGTSKVEEVEEP